MSGEGVVQQARRTPRARHKHSRSVTGPVSDSEGFIAQAGNSHKKSGRRNQQAHHVAQPVPAPAWQDSDPSQMGGFFDAHGNFVSSYQHSAGQQQVPGMFYMSDGVPSHATHQKKKGRQSRNGRHLNGTNTPPHASSDNERILSATMLQSMTPAKAAAYAGPTFHASPAASNLPIPKFFSKSVPNDSTQVGLRARLEQEPDKSDGSDKAESPPAVQPVTAATRSTPDHANESPLDFLFKADKEQKAKKQGSSIATTPPVNRTEGASSGSARANPWQSIYGTGPRNHQRQSSTGSGREMFMMELDTRDASPRPKHISPPPPLPRIPNRSVSDFAALPQLSPPNNGHKGLQMPSFPPVSQTGTIPAPAIPASEQRSTMDHSYSPFNRAGPYPTPHSSESTPTHQQGLYPPQNGLHYGNRNLSPLFKAAKQDSSRPPSGLRQEIQHAPIQSLMAELPDSSPSRPTNPHRRASTQAEKAALAYLQTHVSNAPTMPTLPLPRTAPSELDGVGVVASPAPTGVTPPGANAFNTKSIEDDLKRMLKLTGGIK
ncbi:uncharacterized protein PV09_00379 [Verruconis gallopava]|uniref:Uncharacterized protein n=1 Tax=Verruconis gallopava TaxID=253628 RepID=A0A0D1Z966_9PEZI|nr:uncharacterized protein PV09_00379 [Verruconis gallopava]KIW09502.1 hypothetical protein PV09_00379 [Verruconis gallopava]